MDKTLDTRERDERQSVMSRLKQVDLTLDRRKEKQVLYGWLDTFALKQNQICLIRGQDGSGKSQFLTKAARRSRNRNVLLISQDARRLRGPFGLIRSWIEAVRDADLPPSVAQDLSAFINTRRVLAVLAGQTSDQPASAGWRLPSPGGGDDQRAQLIAELIRFFRIACAHRPLLLAVANFDALDPETRALIMRVMSGLKNAPAGLILTADQDNLDPAGLADEFELSRVHIKPLTILQVQGLLLQVCKRHHLQDAFVDALRAHTAGNASRILLTLWHLIDTNSLVFTKTGWAVPGRIEWQSLPENLHGAVAARIACLSPDAGRLLKGLAAGNTLMTLPRLIGLLGWDRERFTTVATQINRVYPTFRTSEIEIEPVMSSGILRAILEHCTSTTERATWASRMADALADAGSTTHHQELARLYESIGKTEAALTYRIAAAHKAKTVTCFSSAARNLEVGLSHCAKETGLQARLLIRLSDINLLRNQNADARENLTAAIQIAKQTRSLKLEADAKYAMARVETMEGALAEGLTLLDQSLALYKAARKPEGQLAVLSRMTSVYRSLSMWAQSDAINEELLTLAKLEDNAPRVATSLVNASISAGSRGERSKAAEHLYQALRICRKNGYWDLITLALIDFADAAASCAGAENLDRYYLAAVASARRRFDEPREIEAMHKLADIYLSTGAYSLARSAARKVILLAEHQDPSPILGDANRLAGVCAAHQGDREDAERYFAEATRIGERCEDELLKARTLADRGDWEAIRMPARAEALWREARNIFCRLGENTQVLRLDRSLVRHTFEHASRPLRYSAAV